MANDSEFEIQKSEFYFNYKVIEEEEVNDECRDN